MFNMLIGRELQQKMRSREKFVLTVPMIGGLDGKPMSKTSGNTVNITDSAKDMYGKLMTLRDDLVSEYFEVCTNIPMEQVRKIKQTLSPRDFKAQLAKEIVTIYHSLKAAEAAEKEFTRVFREKKQPSTMRRVSLNQKKLPLADLVVRAGLATSKSEARRLIAQRGVKLEGKVQDEPNYIVSLHKGMVLQAGKRRFVKIV